MSERKIQRIGKRQVHLDFHTSEHLSGVGKNFSKEQFQAVLKKAHVDSINVFGKCHHSWSYYPTKVGRQHPGLKFDLLGAQIEACHEIGVLAQIYYTCGWSANDADEHPEWCARNRDGSIITNGLPLAEGSPNDPMPAFHWKFLCVNTGYHDHMMSQVDEICHRYPVDGFWFDIYQGHRLCHCQSCSEGMRKQGIDPDDRAAVEAFNANNIKRHCMALKQLIGKAHPGATVFFNGTTALDDGFNFRHRMYEVNTVQDLEDLPTVWGGYDKLPLQSKFFLKAGWPITAMSGKFHTAWGEFGGYKHPDALKYEAASMIAWGANCNFGDQLHPCGAMDEATYDNIGQAYAYGKSIEEYGVGGVPVARVGFWRSFDTAHDEGLARILLEGHVDFEIANLATDLSGYEVILVPGAPCLGSEAADRLNRFARSGGKLIVIGAGAMDRAHKDLILDTGAKYAGPGRFDVDYLVAGVDLAANLITSPFLNYESTMRVITEPDIEILAGIREPFFSRTVATYTSHQNTPYQLKDAGHPGITRKGNIIHILPAIDSMYLAHGARLHRDLLIRMLGLVFDNPMVKVGLPSTARISLLHQAEQQRYVLHLLYAPPVTRGDCEVIEDLPVLHDVSVRINLPQVPSKALLVPEMRELEMRPGKQGFRIVIPQFNCHCAVVFSC